MSTVNLPLDAFRYIASVQPLHLTVLWPEEGGHYTWPKDLFDGLDVTFVRHPNVKNVMEGEFQWTAEITDFSQGRNKHVIDVLFNGGRNHITPIVKKCLTYGPPGGTVEIPQLNWAATPIGGIRRKWFIQPPWFERSFCTAALTDAIVFSGKTDLDGFLDRARRYVQAVDMPKLKSRAWVAACVDFRSIHARLDEYKAERMKRRESGEWRLFYAGSIRGNKMKAVVDTLSHFRKVNPKVKWVIKTQKSGTFDAYSELSGVELESECCRDAFLASLGQGDIQIAWSELEGACATFFEIAASDMPTIFLDAPWLQDWIPEDYPLRIKTVDEAIAMTKWVMLNWEEAVGWAEKLRLYVDTRMGWEAGGKRFLNALEICKADADADFNERFLSGGMMELIDEVVDGVDEISEDDVYAKMQENSRTGVDFRRRPDILTRHWVRKAVLVHGFRDSGGEKIVYTRKDV